MNGSMKEYAKKFAALAALDIHAAERSLEGFIARLKQEGELKSLPALLKQLKQAAAQQKALAPLVEVAREEDEQRALAHAAEAGIKAETVFVNPALISGWRARADGVLVDRSGKRALTDVYRAIVKQ